MEALLVGQATKNINGTDYAGMIHNTAAKVEAWRRGLCGQFVLVGRRPLRLELVKN